MLIVLSGIIPEPSIRHFSLGLGLQTCHPVPCLGERLGEVLIYKIMELQIFHKMDVFPTGFFFIIFYSGITIPVWIISLFKHAQSYQKLLHQPLSAITSVCSSHHCARPLVCRISINKDALYEFREFQSRSSYKCGNEGYESLSKGKWINRKMEKDLVSIALALGPRLRGCGPSRKVFFLSSTSQTTHLLLNLPHRWRSQDFS